jgi:NCS1 family nucleobase:cation symporter-1
MELWLTSYSSLLGAIGGILIADYYLIKRTELNLTDLYLQEGRYWYRGGFNPIAMIAFISGVIPCVPGFVGKLFPAIVVGDFWLDLYTYAWFISFGISFLIYLIGMSLTRKSIS